MNKKHFTNKIISLGRACCGCGACAASCPKGCIAMEPDACGFLRPAIAADACVGCGACDAVCPVLNPPAEDSVEEAVWAKADDADLLGRSSSGGAFGCSPSMPSRAAASSRARRGRTAAGGSDTSSSGAGRTSIPSCGPSTCRAPSGARVYEGIRDALRSGRPALFCGTACQVAGMRSYLGSLADSELFLGVDVICHGVPSPELWRRWLGYVEGREGGEVHEVNFRSKTTGWLSFSVMYEYMTEKDAAPRRTSTVFRDDWYMRAFLKNASLRGSCLSCPFKRRCGSDITLGDFWGVQRQHPEVSVDGGVSAVLGNTQKGARCCLAHHGIYDRR